MIINDWLTADQSHCFCTSDDCTAVEIPRGPHPGNDQSSLCVGILRYAFPGWLLIMTHSRAGCHFGLV